MSEDRSQHGPATIDVATHRRRRAAAVERLRLLCPQAVPLANGAADDGSPEETVLVVASTPAAYRNDDVEHPHRQDSDLHYLTGFEEPESVLVLSTRAPAEPDAGSADGRQGEEAGTSTLFLRPRDPEREIWDGRRLGVERAVAAVGVTAAHPIEQLATRLPKLLQGHRAVFVTLGRHPTQDAVVVQALGAARRQARRGGTAPHAIIDPGTVLAELRLHKGAEEIALMERAIAITGEAFRRVMAETRPGMFEYEVEAKLTETFRRLGSQRPAYGPIVGGGGNACILHYHENDQQLTDGDLLLIDAGCEYRYYASDITRTFPVNGRFSPSQAELYDVVLAAQAASFEAVRPGATLDDVHYASVRVIIEGLIGLGLVEGPYEKALEDKAYKQFYMHKTSHYLGMDVHDVGTYHLGRKARPLEAGMVITVEPGIYVARGSRAPEQYRGIGIRIEDDVLVTESGYRVLSDAIPRTREAVEAACGDR